MTIIGIGCDILYIPRITKISNSPSRLNNIAKKIMHEAEYENFSRLIRSQNKKLTVSYFASIWCCKEAYYKSLTYNEQKRTPFFQICRQFYKANNIYENNKPVIINPSDHEKNIKVHISLSHDTDYVTSYIIREKL
jgi:phosphopantetheine--protein transferase-like protein